MDKRTLVFSSAGAIDGICALNNSFDKGIIRIAYHGLNMNGNMISKEVFEKAIPSLAYVPVVARYSIDDNEIGDHSIAFIKDDDGNEKMVFLTDPIGVVPSDPHVWWETIVENGQEHEYLCVDVLLWKRQVAYDTIKSQGVVNQSFEIEVTEGTLKDGVYTIDSFEFLALCLLGDDVTPCFESAQLMTFSQDKFKSQYTAMLDDFKKEFANVKEVTTKMKDNKDISEQNIQTYALTANQLHEELAAIIGHEMMVDRWNETICRFIMQDIQDNEVIVRDRKDNYFIKSMPFTVDGDKVTVDFEAMKRKKIVYEDFSEGEDVQDDGVSVMIEEAVNPFKEAAEQAEQEKAEAERKYNELKEKYDQMVIAEEARLEAERKTAMAEIFAQFDKLLENDADYEVLKANPPEDIQELTEKCYAIFGKKKAVMTFSKKNTTIKIAVENNEPPKDMPYGGLFNWKK